MLQALRRGTFRKSSHAFSVFTLNLPVTAVLSKQHQSQWAARSTGRRSQRLKALQAPMLPAMEARIQNVRINRRRVQWLPEESKSD